MKKFLVVCPTLIAFSLFGYFTVSKTQQNAYGLDMLSDHNAWQPDAAALQKQLGAAAAAPGDFRDARHTQFAQLFQHRYRDHQPDAVAVGLHFMNNDTIKLLCPARMEPWNTDKLAEAAWQEARQAFGKPYNVNIYATYIGTPPILIGSLRPETGHPDIAYVTYLSPAQTHIR